MPVVVIVEDGSGLPNANSYVSVADADVYFATRPRSTAWTALSTDDKGAHLIHATRILDASTVWEGTRMSQTQALEFPRTPDDFSSAAVPDPIITALCELAIALVSSDITGSADQDPLKEIKVGPITLVSDSKPISPSTLPQFVRDLIAPWGAAKSKASTVRLYRT